MGNKSLSQLRVDSYPEKKNNLVLQNLDRAKSACNTEKRKMKLIQEYNDQNKDSNFIDSCLSKNVFLCSLDRRDKQELIKNMSLYSVKPNVDIFKQGDAPGCFYILKEGTCDLIINGEKKESLQKGSCFGDTALLFEMNRDYGIKTTSEVQVWIMESELFLDAIENLLTSTHQDNITNVGKLQILSVASNDQKNKLINGIYKESPVSNKNIYEKGNVSHCLYLVKDGSVTLKKDGKTMKNISKGECFGALEVIANTNRITEATPSGRTTLYTIPVCWLKSLYGDNYRSVVALTLVKSAFANCPALRKLNLNFMDELFNRISFKYYENEAEIIRKGEPKNNLIVVPIEGELIDGSNNRTVCQRNNLLFGKEIFEDDT